MFSDEALGNINTELGSKDKPEDFFSIAISHHGIQFGGTREQIENWEDVQTSGAISQALSFARASTVRTNYECLPDTL